MKHFITLLFLGLLCCVFKTAGAQTTTTPFDKYVYKTYSVADGLVGNYIYDIEQDSAGFIWVATTAGVSRFDGTNFKNFTTEDGLPNNEILRLFVDTENRVWMGCLKPVLSYYKNGKIYTVKDPNQLIQKEIVSFGMDATTKKMFCSDGVNLLTVDERLTQIKIISSHNYSRILTRYYTVDNFDSLSYFNFHNKPAENKQSYKEILDKYVIYINDSLFYLDNGKLLPVGINNSIQRFYNQEKVNKLSGLMNNYNCQDNRNFLHYQNNIIENSFHRLYKDDTIFVGKNTHTLLIDKEGCYWAGGINTGLLKLTTKSIRKLNIPQNTEVFAICATANHLLLGSVESTVFRYHPGSYVQLSTKSFRNPSSATENITNRPNIRVRQLLPLNNDRVLVVTDGGLFIEENGNIVKEKINNSSFKSVALVSNNELLVATKYGVNILDKDLKETNTLYNGRVVTINHLRNTVFVGTPTGLVVIDKISKQKKYTILAGKLINDICVTADKIWIAAEDSLFFLDQHGSTLTKIDQLNKKFRVKKINSLYSYKGHIWIATDGGIYKISSGEKWDLPVRYSMADGLPSNQINTVFIKNDIVYVGTPTGACHFREDEMDTYSINNLVFTDASVNDIHFSVRNDTLFEPQTKNISVSFVAIAPKSDGDVTYYYQLNGFDNEWQTTKTPKLFYAKLPAGAYQLQVYAINAFGLRSQNISWGFTIKTVIWQRWWFITLSLLALVALIYEIFRQRLKAIRKKEATLNRLTIQISESEQKALRAQMNPHFIYNCLNSIQQFLVTNDVEQGNKYLTNFASLLRQTLQNSEHLYISLRTECRYITTYLNLELLRFKDKFTYTIAVDEQLDEELTMIPSMVLQPFIENALKHGILNKESGIGQITITFKKQTAFTYQCSIQDNGIGRTATGKLRVLSANKPASKGIEINKRRLQAINLQTSHKANFEIKDIINEEQQITGTEVLLEFPLNTQFTITKKQ
jgi:ligand-binding sensor domain-containing protein